MPACTNNQVEKQNLLKFTINTHGNVLDNCRTFENGLMWTVGLHKIKPTKQNKTQNNDEMKTNTEKKISSSVHICQIETRKFKERSEKMIVA